MTQPIRPTPGLPTKPTGWPVGSYETYEQAQKAVDHLSDNQFHVEKLTIVGVDLMQVERVVGRLTWDKVLGGGIASGAWFGLFVGLIISIFVGGDFWAPIVFCVVAGVVFGIISAAIPYAATRGQRDFASTMQLVAGRYDVLCDPGSAEQARDMLAKLSL
ncbi:general stress protein [Gordonia iterans]